MPAIAGLNRITQAKMYPRPVALRAFCIPMRNRRTINTDATTQPIRPDPATPPQTLRHPDNFLMLHLTHLDLDRDPAARRAVKNEQVEVEFADQAGELMSLEGPNRYLPGDALITGSTGDRWCVSRARFDLKYEALPPGRHGQPGLYRNKPLTVLVKQIREPFTLARSTGGDVLKGAAGDWVLQYGAADYGVIADARFRRVYRFVDPAGDVR